MVFWVVEHKTRGFFTELDYELDGTPTPRFSWSANAHDDRVEKYFHPARAEELIAKLPIKVRAGCSVRRIESSVYL